MTQSSVDAADYGAIGAEVPAGDVRFVSLQRLLGMIESGGLALPAFQRDFDWEVKDVISMLATALVGWPAGSLLLLEGFPTYLGESRPVEGGPPPTPSVEFALLDGQQRVTALYQALENKGDVVYALDIRRVAEIDHLDNADQFEDALVTFRRDEWTRSYKGVEAQWQRGVFPLYAGRTASLFFEWRDKVLVNAMSDTNERLDVLERFFANTFGSIHSYRFPAIVLPESMDVAAVARVFERVNKTGEPLDTFDLVTARTYRPDFNLRELVVLAARDDPLVGEFLGNTGLAPLQAIGLTVADSVRKSELVRLEPGAIREEWGPTLRAFRRVAELLVHRCGVISKAWLPYDAQLVVMTAAIRQHETRGDEISDAALEAWFWRTGFGQVFKVAANTTAVSEYRRLVEQPKPDTKVTVDPRVVVEATRKVDAGLFKAIVCAFAMSGPISADQGTIKVTEPAVDSARTVPVPGLAADSPFDRTKRAIAQIVVSKTLTVRQLALLLQSATGGTWPQAGVQMLPRPATGFWTSWKSFVDFRLSGLGDTLEPFGITLASTALSDGPVRRM